MRVAAATAAPVLPRFNSAITLAFNSVVILVRFRRAFLPADIPRLLGATSLFAARTALKNAFSDSNPYCEWIPARAVAVFLAIAASNLAIFFFCLSIFFRSCARTARCCCGRRLRQQHFDRQAFLGRSNSNQAMGRLEGWPSQSRFYRQARGHLALS